MITSVQRNDEIVQRWAGEERAREYGSYLNQVAWGIAQAAMEMEKKRP